MSLEQCLGEAVAANEITQAEADALQRRFESLKQSNQENGPNNAASRALEELKETLKAQAASKRRQAKIAIRHLKRLETELVSHEMPDGSAQDIGSAALFKLEHYGEAEFMDVAHVEESIIAFGHAKLENLLYNFRRGAIGGDLTRHNKAQLPNVVKEAFGVDTGDQAAKEFAKAWNETAEWLRKRFNDAGGNIGKLENWGMPQHHDQLALINAGKSVWVERIKPMLDVSKMKHPLTGKAIREYDLDEILDHIWDEIATDGANSRKASRRRPGVSKANQRAESRYLVFKDPEAWLEYQTDFGGGADPYASMMNHVSSMAKDIAMIEELGPNPGATIEYMKQRILNEGSLKQAGKTARNKANSKKAMDRAKRQAKKIEDVYHSISGDLQTPINTKAANFLAGTRNWITASVLGSASISAISDLGIQKINRLNSGIHGSVLKDTLRQFKGASRREAVESGLILQSAQHVMNRQARYVGTMTGPTWTSYLADRVLTFSGLTPWTQAGRHGFGLAFQNTLAVYRTEKFDDLPELLQRTFKRHGINELDWDMMRRVKQQGQSDLRLLRPTDVAEGNERLGTKYLAMILRETEMSIPSGGHRSRTALIGDTQPGTFLGEVARSFSQFKSFGSVFMILHGNKIHNMIASGQHAQGAVYAAGLLTSTTVLGAFAMQLKQIAAGRDPRDMDTPSFWGAALLQGGGLGVYGDFLFADINRFGGGFATTLAGPVVGKANEFWNLTAGNAVQLATNQKTHFGRELVKFGRGMVPGGNIWYLRSGWERIVMDNLQYAADPEAHKAFRRTQKYWQRTTGQEYFWAPGTMAPDRAPSFQ